MEDEKKDKLKEKYSVEYDLVMKKEALDIVTAILKKQLEDGKISTDLKEVDKLPKIDKDSIEMWKDLKKHV